MKEIMGGSEGGREGRRGRSEEEERKNSSSILKNRGARFSVSNVLDQQGRSQPATTPTFTTPLSGTQPLRPATPQPAGSRLVMDGPGLS